MALIVVGLAFPALAAPPGDPGHALSLAELEASRFLPTIRVVDTVSSLGPLSRVPQTVTVADLVRFHGHPCDGLVVAAAGVAWGLQALFPDGLVDRTDMVAAVNRSACYGDVVAYLTGARTRYGSLVIDPQLGDTWVLHRRSSGRTIRVALRPGVKPPELAPAEGRLREGGCDAGQIASVQALQRRYALRVASEPPGELFVVTELEKFPYEIGSARPDASKAGCPTADPPLRREAREDGIRR